MTKAMGVGILCEDRIIEPTWIQGPPFPNSDILSRRYVQTV
jgi:hypothetical protein